ncbi:hypothetical protein J1605_003437 [Eschrichtius robustus]|uniref:FHA domain-containing protein n=1 Tax=Eschrichtius robustus TaxID=9764 RepID=A0AB34HMD8_ESCRO|nr:hypothetical protein J1605_003437 [Eschrichtius robustus]
MQGTRVRALVWEDPTCRGATGPVSHNYRACASGACAPQQERPRQGIECDIRIQLPVVSKQHCKIEINEQEAILFNFSSTNPTQVNGSTFDKPVQLKHGDVITVVDRSFR